MKQTFITSLLFSCFLTAASAQNIDTLPVRNKTCLAIAPPVDYQENTLSYTIEKDTLKITKTEYKSSTPVSPVAFTSIENDTIIIQVVDTAQIALPAVCRLQYSLHVPFDITTDTILLKINGRLYKIKNIATSVEEGAFLKHMVIYPNPNQGIIFLQNGNNHSGDMLLSNATGIEMMHLQGVLPARLDLQHLPQGLYHLTVTSGQTTIHKTILKQ